MKKLLTLSLLIAMIATIIDDKRFTNLDGQSIGAMIRIVNHWLAPLVVNNKELEETLSFYDPGYYYLSKEEARQKYPEESAKLEKHLEEWRKKLKTCIPTLLNKKR